MSRSNNDLVSIILPTYNRHSYLSEAIQSVLNQTYENFELIVVDDGSDISAQEIIRKFKDARLNFIRIEKSGRSYARNVGLSRAKGEFVTFIDDDDLYVPKKLFIQIKYLKSNPQLSVVYSAADCFQTDPSNIIMTYRANFQGNIYAQLALYVPHPICFPTVMVRSSVIKEIGKFDVNLDRFEDTDFLRRIAKKYSFGAIDYPLCKIRTHSGNQMKSLNLRVLKQQVDKYVTKVLSEDYANEKILLRLSAELYKHYGKAVIRQNFGLFIGFRMFMKSQLLRYADVLLSSKLMDLKSFTKLINFGIEIIFSKLKI